MMMFRGLIVVLASLALIAVLWYILSIIFAKPYILPTPLDVARSLASMVVDGRLLVNMVYTIARVLLGFILGVASGLVIGVLVLTYRFLRDTVYPIIAFIAATPSIAFIPLLMIWVGVGDMLPVVAAMICVSFPLAYAMISASKSIDPEIIDVALTLSSSKRDLVFRIMLPLAITHVASLLKYEMGHSWRIVFITEYLALSTGLGSLMFMAYSSLKVDEIIAVIIVLGLLALATQYAIEYLETIIMERWGMVK